MTFRKRVYNVRVTQLKAVVFSTVGVILSAAGDIMNNVGEGCSAQWRDIMIVQDVQSPEGMKFPDFSLTFPD